MTDELVSIIIPVYNVQKYVGSCIKSCINQTYENIEIILVDDGSTDNSGKICDEYSKRDNRISVIHTTNRGQGSARNIGLNKCTGDFITFLDADDVLNENFIQILQKLLINYNADIVACNYLEISDDGNQELGCYSSIKGIRILNGYEVLECVWGDKVINVAPWAKLYTKKIWENNRFVECFSEDSATMYKIYGKDVKVVYTGKPLVKYRLRVNSDVRSFNSKKLIMLDIYDDIVDYVFKRDFPLKVQNAAIAKAVSSNFHIFCQLPDDNKEVEDRIKKFIKKYRKRVLFDKDALLKRRVACMLSYVDFELVRKIFNFNKK